MADNSTTHYDDSIKTSEEGVPVKHSATVDPLKVFKSACAFRRAATLLIDPYKKGDGDLVFPFATNAALAAELFIKCLLCLDKSPAKGHFLQELFCKLNKTHQEQITKLFGEEVKKKTYIPGVENFDSSFKFEIDKVLKATNNSFTEWRYIYEDRPTVVFFGMEELLDALYNYILTVEPMWVQKA